jgi:hypothetical protein
MDHDELMELAAAELAAVLEQIEARGTCPDCLAELLLMVAVGMRRDIHKDGQVPVLALVNS